MTVIPTLLGTVIPAVTPSANLLYDRRLLPLANNGKENLFPIAAVIAKMIATDTIPTSIGSSKFGWVYTFRRSMIDC